MENAEESDALERVEVEVLCLREEVDELVVLDRIEQRVDDLIERVEAALNDRAAVPPGH